MLRMDRLAPRTMESGRKRLILSAFGRSMGGYISKEGIPSGKFDGLKGPCEAGITVED